VIVKGLFHLLLALGALIGLLGEQSVAARNVAPASVHATAGAMDCMEMMKEASVPSKQPCKSLSLDCIAASGCVIPITGRDVALNAPFTVAPISAFWPPTRVLVGSDTTPEQRPPSTLV